MTNNEQPDIIAHTDQFIAATKQISQATHALYHNLKTEGFTKDQAFTLTQIYFDNTFNPQHEE